MISPPNATPTFHEAVRAWSRVALASFGGPAGQIAVIHRIIVEENRWVDERRFFHALGYCMLLPGPEAQQLATYLGWTLHGTRGGLAAGTLFVLPGFVAILALSVVYVLYGSSPFVTGAFFGLKPAVFAVVLLAVARFRRKALEHRWGPAVAVGAFLLMFVFRFPFPAVVATAAATGYLLFRGGGDARLHRDMDSQPRRPPPLKRLLRTTALWVGVWLAPVAALALLLPLDHVLFREAVFFSKVAVVTIGGAYAVLSYVAQQAVDVYSWLTPSQMLDGLGLAESTPGPLIMVVQFVGFLGAYTNAGGLEPLAAAALGSLITTWVTFAPCFLFVFAGAPYIEYLRGNAGLQAALSGVLAAVAGVVLNLALWFGLNTLFSVNTEWRWGAVILLLPELASVSWAAVAIAGLSLVAMSRFHIGMLRVFATAVGAGVAMHLFAT